jgi:hypothetical protein
MANPPTPVAVTLTYVDRPDVGETYVDSLERIHSDGPTVRIELVVNRIGAPTAPGPATGQRHTAARLVLPITGFPDFVSKVNGLMNTLVQQGTLKAPQIAPATAPLADGKPE